MSHDKAKMKEFWSPIYKAWFPQGSGNAGHRPDARHGRKPEYWDFSSGKLVQLVEFAKAVVTGERNDANQNERANPRYASTKITAQPHDGYACSTLRLR